MHSRITFDQNRSGGQACIRNLRIRVSDILDMLAETTQEEILQDFPDLEPADISAALHFAAKRAEIPRIAA